MCPVGHQTVRAYEGRNPCGWTTDEAAGRAASGGPIGCIATLTDTGKKTVTARCTQVHRTGWTARERIVELGAAGTDAAHHHCCTHYGHRIVAGVGGHCTGGAVDTEIRLADCSAGLDSPRSPAAAAAGSGHAAGGAMDIVGGVSGSLQACRTGQDRAHARHSFHTALS